jgi:hypothetical protein
MPVMMKRGGLVHRLRKVSFLVSLLLASVLQSVIAASAQKPVAELPRVYIDTTWSRPSGGTTRSAHTSAELSNALAKSVPGDVIVLDAGVVYTGNFKVPAKSNPNKQWVYVISSAYSSLPAPGTRVAPTDAANMPKIVSPNASQALSFADGSNHWRFAGIEVYSASTYKPPGYSNFYAYALIDKVTYPSVTLPDSIVFDRVYVHGDDTHDVQRGISANYSNTALVDSYISDIHMGGTDVQAYGAWETPGPIKVVNNYLSAATENLHFGGAGGPNNPYIPSDMEIRDNYLFKPLSWVPMSYPSGNALVVKNAFELKSARRVLFEHNTIENVWMSAQAGYAIVLTVRTSQSGDIAVVDDITITNNILKNVTAGFNAGAADDVCANGPKSYPNCKNAGSQERWYIGNNLVTFYDPTIKGGGRNLLIAFQPGFDHIKGVQGVVHDVVVQHNTIVPSASGQCWSSVYFGVARMKPPLTNLTSNIWILDNVLCRQPSGDFGLQGTTGLTQYMGSPGTPPNDLTQRFIGNVMHVPAGDREQPFPPHNLSTTKAFVHVDPAKGNFELLPSKWNQTSDGKRAGIDFAKLPQQQ